jgi:hypothetical protein
MLFCYELTFIHVIFQREENAEKVKEHEDVIHKLKKQKMVKSL